MLNTHINKYKVLIYTKATCGYTDKAVDLFNKGEVDFKLFNLDDMEEPNLMKQALFEITGQRTVPNIFINSQHIGGYSHLKELHEQNKLKGLLDDAYVRHIF
ncbi:unnamed protein product [Moneuplotes crassus]|uniref:Glutaredoxin domain-containing protein n=1 Tax=Euplotes crassus TaxID=5936 RepID=A0AAD1Y5D4_EUPCR|nr:unnamed protein product [Moneuplotes crassus]